MGMAGLSLRSGILVRLVEFGLNPAFAVQFLRSQNLPHQGSLARLVLYVRILASRRGCCPALVLTHPWPDSPPTQGLWSREGWRELQPLPDPVGVSRRGQLREP